MKRAYQFDLLSTIDENNRNAELFDKNLPVSPLQYKIADEEPFLTDREFEIMDMTLKGLEIYNIAMKVCLSVAGVKYRLSNVYQKFGVQNRLQLINKASKVGLQFRRPSGVKQTFHIKLDTRDHQIEETNVAKS
jgi:DNA-binding NarL/FixJ family response regulator